MGRSCSWQFSNALCREVRDYGRGNSLGNQGPYQGRGRGEQQRSQAHSFLSQNFLRSRQLVDHLLQSSDIGPEDIVYEIGPGRGIITERLARRCREVVAIEKDPSLVARLRTELADLPNVLVLEGDFLEHDLPRSRYKVFSNPPFSITAQIVQKLTGAPRPPEDTYLIVQQEAAWRYLGTPRETLSSVLLKADFVPSITYRFRREDFHPHPGVEVVMLRLLRREADPLPSGMRQVYRDFVTYGFTAWRPSLKETLRPLFARGGVDRLWKRLDLRPDATPTSLAFEQWLGLFYSYLLLEYPRGKHLFSGAEDRLRAQQAHLDKPRRTRIRRDQ